MPIASDVIRGHTDTIILAQLSHGESYGYRINKDIQAKTGKQYELKEATLYSAFRRLEKEGLIRSFWGDEDLGARRRYYAITEPGTKALEQYRKDWLEAKQTIDSLIFAQEEANND